MSDRALLETTETVVSVDLQSSTDQPTQQTHEPTQQLLEEKQQVENSTIQPTNLLEPTDEGELNKENEKVVEVTKKTGISKEMLQTVAKLCIPMVVCMLLDYFSVVVELIFFGTFGTAELAAAALAASFANVTGNSVLIGLLTPLDTLISQAYGANQKQQIGLAVQRGIIVAFTGVILMFPVWFYSGELLRLLHQDESVIIWTQLYLRIVWFGMFANAINATARKFLTNQSILFPQLIALLFGLCFTAVANFIFVYLLGFGFTTIPTIRVINYHLQLCIYVSIIFIFKMYKGTWVPWSWHTVTGIVPFVKLSISTTVSLCAEWWAFEIHSFIAGLFGVVSLAAMTIIMNVLAVMFMSIVGISIAASVLVGNAVGSENISLARKSGAVCLFLGIIVQLIQVVPYFGLQDYWPRIFSDDEEVIAAIQSLIPIICIFLIPDALQNILGGNLRGAGKLHFPTVVNLMSYYGIGLIISLTLAFYFEMGIVGQWLGLECGNAFSASVLGTYYLFLNWNKVVRESKIRLEENKCKDTDTTIEIELEEKVTQKASEDNLTIVV